MYALANGLPQEAKVLALTGTVQYDLWANVISRLEVRWDTSADGSPHFGGDTAIGHPDQEQCCHGCGQRHLQILTGLKIIRPLP